MSKVALAWARQQAIQDGAMKPVLVELAILHMEGKELFPSQGHLAAATGNSERTVRDALKLLQHFNLIRRWKRSNGAGGRTSDGFTLAIGTEFVLTKSVILDARKALSNRRNLPVAEPNLPPAKFAGTPGEICRGIGELGDSLSHVGTVLSVGQCVETADDRPTLKLVVGGRP